MTYNVFSGTLNPTHFTSLHFTCIIEALSIVANWRERASASKAYNLLQTVCSCEFIVAMFSLSDVLSVTLPVSKMLRLSLGNV